MRLSLHFCGPKCSYCCFVLGIWGILMLVSKPNHSLQTQQREKREREERAQREHREGEREREAKL